MYRLMLVLALLQLTGCGTDMAREAARRTAIPDSESGSESAGELPGAAQASLERKIIYEAHLQLVVEELEPLQEEIAQLVQRHEGYLALVQVDRSQGRRLSGRWVARIPVTNYGTFLEEVAKLGVLERFDQNAQDVTEEYVDLQARIANKKQLEQRILQLLEEPKGEIKDIIEVEQELARVREEIERMEGRLRYLENRTALTTVTMEVLERDFYVPARAPSFVGRVSYTWERSLTLLGEFAENVALVLIFLAPWLAILLICLLPAALVVRMMRGRSRRPPPAA